MNYQCALVAAALLAMIQTACDLGGENGAEPPAVELSVMTFNIEYGGDRVDFGQLSAAVRLAGADVVGIQEAWGRMPRLASDLGWDHFDTRMQVVSRYPLVDPGGADGTYILVEVSPGRVVALGNVHLPSDPYGPSEVRDGAPPELVLDLERRVRLPAIAREIDSLSAMAAAGIPTFLTGDVNSPSFADWIPEAIGIRSHLRYALDWPVSRALDDAGFVDTYRFIHPDPISSPGLTWPAQRQPVEGWNPAPDETEERIDVVFAAGDITILDSRIIGESGASDLAVIPWPSDHRAVVSTFQLVPAPMPRLIAVGRRSLVVGDSLSVVFSAPQGTARSIAVRAVNGGDWSDSSAEQGLPGSEPTHGRTTFATDMLAPGRYEVAILDDADRTLARTEVWLFAPGDAAEVTVDRERSSSGEPFLVEWSNAPGNRWDWVGVYPAGADPSDSSHLLWRHTGASIAGTAAIDASAEGTGWPLAPGEYRVSLFIDDGYEEIATTSLIVEEPPEPPEPPSR